MKQNVDDMRKEKQRLGPGIEIQKKREQTQEYIVNGLKSEKERMNYPGNVIDKEKNE